MSHLAEYAGLFFAALLSATILPFQSEVVLFGMLLTHHYSALALVLVASLGNILGSCLNWLMGRFLARFEDRPWFPLRRDKIEKAEGWYHRYGRWTLLLSWTPVIGDPLTMVAGVMREPLRSFLVIVAIAKTGRYVVIASLVLFHGRLGF